MNMLKGKFALVTGGLGGIGYEIVKAFLNNRVVGLSVLDLKTSADSTQHKTLNNLTREYGNKVLFIPTDVGETAQLESAFEKTVKTFKHLDIVVNAAGVVNETNLRACVNINLIGTMEATYLAIDKYFPKYCGGNGTIVNIASIAGLTSYPFTEIYGATKQGVVGFSKSIGAKVKNTNVKLFTICPGVTDTGLIHKDVLNRVRHEDREICLKVSEKSKQPPCAVSKALVKIMPKATSGSCWVVDENEWYEVEFKPYLEMKKINTS